MTPRTRLERLEVIWQRRFPGHSRTEPEPAFDLARLTREQQIDLNEICSRLAPSDRDPYGFAPLSVEDLERLLALGRLGQGLDPEACPQGLPGGGGQRWATSSPHGVG